MWKPQYQNGVTTRYVSEQSKGTFSKKSNLFVDLLNLKNVARGLAGFISELLPPTCDHDNNLELIKELCKLAVLLLQKPRTQIRFNIDAVISFMGTLLTMYGGVLDCTLDNSMTEPPSGKDIENIVKTMIWTIIETEQAYLDLIWTDPIKGSEQGNGQSALESKSAPIQKNPIKKSNMESLSGVLSFMTLGLVACPLFMITIPASAPTMNGSMNDHDESKDLLIRRAAVTAIMSLDEHHDIDAVQNAVTFLLALVRSHMTYLRCFNLDMLYKFLTLSQKIFELV